MEGHFPKSRKLVPTLALVTHLADGGVGSVGKEGLSRPRRGTKALSLGRTRLKLGTPFKIQCRVEMIAHGSSRNRRTPGVVGFLILSHALLGPDRYGCSRCFETIPSAPS